MTDRMPNCAGLADFDRKPLASTLQARAKNLSGIAKRRQLAISLNSAYPSAFCSSERDRVLPDKSELSTASTLHARRAKYCNYCSTAICSCCSDAAPAINASRNGIFNSRHQNPARNGSENRALHASPKTRLAAR
jgi:hypothetical protein